MRCAILRYHFSDYHSETVLRKSNFTYKLLLGLRYSEGWEPDHLRNQAGFSWSYQNCLGLSLDFLGPIGFVAANLAANWPQAALVKRYLNLAKTAL